MACAEQNVIELFLNGMQKTGFEMLFIAGELKLITIC